MESKDVLEGTLSSSAKERARKLEFRGSLRIPAGR